MKFIKGWCWVMVLVWLSANAFAAVVELYEAGGLWRVGWWLLTLSAGGLWVLGIWMASQIIRNKENPRDDENI